MTKKLKSPSPQVKLFEQAQRLASPDPVPPANNFIEQGPKGDGMKKGIVFEKRRLSQKRISELS